MVSKTSYEKDVEFLTLFLNSRSNFLYLDTVDLYRAERLVEQTAISFDRPLYVTNRGRGVFYRHYSGYGVEGREDIPVVRALSSRILDHLMAQYLHLAPELTIHELEALREYYNKLDNPPSVAPGQMPPSPAQVASALADFPQPIPFRFPRSELAKFLEPRPVRWEKVSDLVADSIMELDEFLVRMRLKIRRPDESGSPAEWSPLVLAGEGFSSAFAILGSLESQVINRFGSQYGLEGGQNAPPVLFNCLEMMTNAPPEQDIIFLMEGFKTDFNPSGQTINQESVSDLEYTIKKLGGSTNQIVLVAPSIEFEGESATTAGKMMTLYTLNYPDFDGVDDLVRETLASIYNQKSPESQELYENVIHNMIDPMTMDEEGAEEKFDKMMAKVANALRGLTESEILQIVWRSIRATQNLDPKVLDRERKEAINKTPGLKVFDPNVPLDAVGGMESLKFWITSRGADELFMTPAEAEEKFGGHSYKGIMLIGLPGTGKSLITKAIANYLASESSSDKAVSLVQLDIGALRGKYVGQTESQTRRALKTVEAFAPVVLWIDEIEKAFSGSGGDSGSEITVRMIGQFLTFMQERTEPVFFIATSNDIASLRPEFKRKGRWDAMFYIPPPDAKAAYSILKYQLSRFGIDIQDVIERTPNGKAALMRWVRLASSGNETGEASPILRVETSEFGGGKKQTAVTDDVGNPVMRHLGYMGAEIEEGIKQAASRLRFQHKDGWKDKMTMNDLIVSLQQISPSSRGKTETGQTMASLMYELEKQGDPIISPEQLTKSLEEVRQSIEEMQVDQEELDAFMQELGVLKKEISESKAPSKKKKKPRRNPDSTERYLLGRDFYNLYR